MKVDFYFIDELSTDRVAFYTVKLGDSALTEYEDFAKRMSIKDVNRFDLSELQKFIKTKIGVFGPDGKYFKKEDEAERIKQPTPDEYDENLPDPKDYGLRLFCIRLSDEVVVLFNGDRKTYKDVRYCPNCQPYFLLAKQLAVAIFEAYYVTKRLVVNGFDILYRDEDDDEEEFYIHI